MCSPCSPDPTITLLVLDRSQPKPQVPDAIPSVLADQAVTSTCTRSVDARRSSTTPTASPPPGMAVARAKGKLKGRQPKLSAKQRNELRRMHGSGDYSITDLAELFKVSRPTVYRTLAESNSQTKAT